MKFNLPAPSSVEWYRSGVPGGGQKDRIFNRLKAKLIGGKDDSGTSYFKMHDRKLSNSDADKIIANMKQDEDGYPTFSTGSTSGEAEREYQEWIIDRYLVDAPTSKPPEDIPVEIEVVEVEQKTVDEPIVVKIEAPFEPEPQKKLEAPKRIRLPRRSGLMKARPIGPPREEKKSAAKRMSDAFDKRLDDLVDAVQNPPAPAQPKKRKQKESLVKIKKKVKPAKFKSRYKESGNVKPFENLGKFTFNKVKSAFGRAADARRMAQEQGLPEQGKGYYAFRSLGFEFGGDRIARTRGTFSKSPDATLDPSLSKQQRYTEGLFGTRSIRPAKGGGKFDGLTKEFKKLDDALKNVIDAKKESPDSSETTKEFNKTVAEIRDALKKGNKLDQSIVDSKKEQEKIARDAANDAEMGAKEASIEGTEDTAGLGEIEKKAKEEEKKKDDKGPGFDFNFRWLKDLRKNAGKWWRRIKNPGKTLQAFGRLGRAKLSNFLRRIPGGKGLANRVSNIRVGNPFKNLKLPGTPKGMGGAGGAGGILSRLRGIKIPPGLARAGGMLRGLGGKLLFPLMALDVYEQTKKVFNPNDNIITSLQDFGQSNVEMFKLLTGNSDPFEQSLWEQRGDYSQMEEGSQEWIKYKGNMNHNRRILAKRQAADPERYNKEKDSVLQKHPYVKDFYDNPDPQNRFNLRPPDVSQYGDIPEGYELKKQDDGTWKMVKKEEEKLSAGGVVKLAEGGVNAMVGEAGPELVTNGPGGVNPLQSLAPMIVSMRELTKRAGTWADPIENMVRQITDPIAKQLKLPVLPATVDIGSGGGGGEVKEQKEMKGIGGLGQDILDTFSALFSGGSTPGVTPPGGFQGATLSGSAAQLIGNDTEFLAEVTRVCRKFGIKEGDLLGLMASESGFNPASDNGTHVGLIQFSRDSARAVGTTQAALKGMTRAQQMTYVEKYFDHWKSAGYFPDNPTAGQLYSVVFAPAYANKQDHEALYSAGSAAYNSNRPLDTNNDGQITMAEMGQRIQRKKQEFGITDSGVSASPTATPPTPPAAPPLTPQPAPPSTTGTGTALLPLLTQPAALTPQQPASAFTLGNPFVSLPGTSLTQLQQLRLAQ